MRAPPEVINGKVKGLFAWRNSGEIWMVWRNAGGICERKTLFRMKKEADQAGFKGTRTGPKQEGSPLEIEERRSVFVGVQTQSSSLLQRARSY